MLTTAVRQKSQLPSEDESRIHETGDAACGFALEASYAAHNSCGRLESQVVLTIPQRLRRGGGILGSIEFLEKVTVFPTKLTLLLQNFWAWIQKFVNGTRRAKPHAADSIAPLDLLPGTPR